jgi:hypothetical protein
MQGTKRWLPPLEPGAGNWIKKKDLAGLLVKSFYRS